MKENYTALSVSQAWMKNNRGVDSKCFAGGTLALPGEGV
jgi:hypothetical protein